MRFGVWLPAISPFTTPELLAEVGRVAQQRGVDTIWVGEHVVLFDEYASSYPYAADGRLPADPDNGILDPLTTLTFLAAHTTTVRLGTAVCLLPQRNLVYTAKETATLDVLSGGRLDFGVGSGWLAEEFAAVGVPFAHRGRRTDDYLAALVALWTTDPSAYDGEFLTIPPCRLHPKPVQTPHPPLHIGGESDAALRRVARHGQGWHTFNRLPADLAEPLARLEAHLAAQGRSRADVQVTVCSYFHGMTPELVDGYARAGVDEVVALLFVADVAGVRAAFDDLAASQQRAQGA